MPMEQSYTVQGIAFLSPPLIFFGNFDLFCPSVETLYIYIFMNGVQNSRSQGLYGLRKVGIGKLILHFGYEAGRN